MKCAILGYGTIGEGVYRLAKEAGIEVTHILDLRPVPEGLACTMEEIAGDPEVDVVIETMGGLHPAFEFALAALEHGKHFVTANKYLVSEYGIRLAQAAREHGVCFRFNAACGGGIAYLSTLKTAERVDRIRAVGGILNGTTNYILDRMQRFGEDYDAALKKAQALGYAEKDPSADVDGLDTMRKCMLSCAVAYHFLPENIPVAGIRNITARDVEAIKALSRVCRLTAYADGEAAFVQPTLFAPTAPEASIFDNVNLAWYEGEQTGRFTFSGQGAGRFPTAGNVLRDVLSLADGTMMPADCPVKSVDCSRAERRYYARVPEGFELEGETLWQENGFRAVLTGPVSVTEMHNKMKNCENAFFAGWSEE